MRFLLSVYLHPSLPSDRPTQVKYGLSLQLTRVLVRPLSAPPTWAWSLGGLDVAYDAAGRFHAQAGVR